MNSLKDKVALITGGTSGMGAATAKLFHEEGATVIVTGSSDGSVGAVRKAMPYVKAIVSDAGDPKAAKALVDLVSSKHGGIDVLFVNAGIAPLAAADEAHFDELFRVDVRRSYLLINLAGTCPPRRRVDHSYVIPSCGAGNARVEPLRSHQSGPALLRTQFGSRVGAASHPAQHHYRGPHQHSDQPENGAECGADCGFGGASGLAGALEPQYQPYGN